MVGLSEAYRKLMGLFSRFQELGSISQRAVIARLLTTVAETLASKSAAETIDGYTLIPEDLTSLNQGKIFEIVIFNLLQRDQGIGSLSASNRRLFLRQFAIAMQQRGRDFFATPTELRAVVEDLFADQLARTDTPEQLLENLYRTCRRHSGLTTEGQFMDNAGQLDSPVSELDQTSRIGFSHNSLREYLVAEAFENTLATGRIYKGLEYVVITELVGDFLFDMMTYHPLLLEQLCNGYKNYAGSRMGEQIFRIIYRVARRLGSPGALVNMLGVPPKIDGVDLSGLDLSLFSLRGVSVKNCVALDTDFRGAELSSASFSRSIFANVMLDGVRCSGADFREAEIDSIYVFDRFGSNTSAVLKGREARQWLFSNGALVSPADDLNPLMGKAWYEAAREVMRTLERRIAGTHEDRSLSKGTRAEYRVFAREFVDFLINCGVLEKIKKAKKGSGWVVRVQAKHRNLVHVFSSEGKIDPIIEPFFVKHRKAMRPSG